MVQPLQAVLKYCIWIISVPLCQNTFPSRLIKQRYGPFQFLAYLTTVCQGKSTKALEKCSPIRESLWGNIFHALGMVFRLFRDIFVYFFAMRPCFQRPFSSISCIFTSSKHVPIAKKWQKRRERVLTNCNHAKSDGNVVSTKAYAQKPQHMEIHLLSVRRFFCTGWGQFLEHPCDQTSGHIVYHQVSNERYGHYLSTDAPQFPVGSVVWIPQPLSKSSIFSKC